MQRGGSKCVMKSFSETEEEIKGLPDDEWLPVRRRLGAWSFVDEPGDGKHDNSNGGDDAGGGGEPVVVVPISEVEAGIEDENERAGDGDGPKAVIGIRAPGPEEQAGEAARTQNGDQPAEGREQRLECFSGGRVKVSKRGDEAAGFRAEKLSEAGEPHDEDRSSEDVLRGEGAREIQEGCGRAQDEQSGKSPARGKQRRQRQERSKASGGANEERDETKRMKSAQREVFPGFARRRNPVLRSGLSRSRYVQDWYNNSFKLRG